MSIQKKFMLSMAASAAITSGIAQAEEAFDKYKAQPIMSYSSQECNPDEWVESMKQFGFIVDHQVNPNIERIVENISPQLEDEICHIAMVGDYYVAGEVPPELISQILAFSPNIKGMSMDVNAEQPSAAGAYSVKVESLEGNFSTLKLVY